MPPTDIHTLFGDSEPFGGFHHRDTFNRKNLFFDSHQIASVAGQVTIAANDAMTRDMNGYRIVTERLGYCTHGFRLANDFGDSLIGDYRTIRHLSSGAQNLTLKIAAHQGVIYHPPQVTPLAVEVILEVVDQVGHFWSTTFKRKSLLPGRGWGVGL